METVTEPDEEAVQPPATGFFADPSSDLLVSAMLSLASEVWVLAERVATIEAVAAAKGYVTLDELKHYAPRADEAADREAAGRAFVHRVFGQFRQFQS